MKEILFQAQNIVKKFGPTIALNGFSFQLEPGQVHGLIGENGSGKSTMSALMSGIYKPTSGYMLFQGQPWEPKTMLEALGQKGGIGICVQEKGTADDISIAENIFLGEYSQFSGHNFFSFDEKEEVVFSEGFKVDLQPFEEVRKKTFLLTESIREKGEYPFLTSQKLIRSYKAESRKAQKDFKKMARNLKRSGEKEKLLSETKKFKEMRLSYQTLLKAEEEKSSLALNTYKAEKQELRKAVSSFERFYKLSTLDLKKSFSLSVKQRMAEAKDELVKQKRAIEEEFKKRFLDLAQENEENKKKIEEEADDLSLRKKAFYLLKEDEKEDIRELESEKNKKLNSASEKYIEKEAEVKQDQRSLKAYLTKSLRDIKDGTLREEKAGYRFLNKFLDIVFYPFVNKRKMNGEAVKALMKIGLGRINPALPARAFSLQDRKLVELAKILNKDPQIVILDETSNNLTEEGRQLLYKSIANLKKQGKAILFISHDIEELLSQCDYLTILRDGQKVGEFSKDSFDEDQIKKLMVGREINKDYYRQDYNQKVSSHVVLEMKEGYFNSDLNNVSLQLHQGEILGIGGIADCGMHALGKALFGALHLDEGEVYCGKDLNRKVTNERVAMANKIGYVSKDRDLEALALNDSIHGNIALASLRNLVKENMLVFRFKEKKIVDKEVDDLSIKCASSNQTVSDLSGGNKQKVSLAKWLGNKSEILILDCPTRGVDIGVKQFIYQLLYQMKMEGKSIVLISEELPELIGMSDRLLVMKDGSIKKEFARDPALTQREILEYMI